MEKITADVYNELTWENEPVTLCPKEFKWDVENGELYKRVFKYNKNGECQELAPKLVSATLPCIVAPYVEYINNLEREEYFKLVYIDRHGKKCETLVRGEDLRSKAKMVRNLSKYLDVTDRNASDLIEYFSAIQSQYKHVLAENERIATTVNKIMTINGEKRILTPMHSDKGEVMFIDNGDNTAKTHTLKNSSGTYEEWVDNVLAHVKGLPNFEAIMLVAIGTPLLEVLNMNSFILDVGYKSSKGKSTAFKVACSMLGNWHYLMETFGSGNVMNSMDKVLGYYNFLPVFYDEGKLLSDKVAKSLPYTVEEGQSKNRSEQSGAKNQKKQIWRTVLFTNGEIPLTERLGEGDGGSYARVFQIKEAPIDGYQPKLAKTLLDNIEKYYGTFYPKWLEHVEKIINDEEEIRAIIEMKEKWGDVLEDKYENRPEVKRASTYYTIIPIVQYLLKKYMGIELGEENLINVMLEQFDKNEDIQLSMSQRMVADVLDKVVRNSEKVVIRGLGDITYYIKEKGATKVQACWINNELYVAPEMFAEHMNVEKLPLQMKRNMLEENLIIKRDKDHFEHYKEVVIPMQSLEDETSKRTKLLRMNVDVIKDFYEIENLK